MTHLSETVGSSLDAIRGINAKIAALREEAKSERQKALEPFLAALAASGEVSLIVVRGYTPGFNDGEPCEHSADFWVNVKECMSNDAHEDRFGFELSDEIVDGIESEDTYDREARRYVTNPAILKNNIDLCAKHGHVYQEPSKQITDAIRELILATAENENSTNYYVSYVLTDGKFEINTGEYDCGY